MPRGAWPPPVPTRTLLSAWGSSPLDSPVAACRSSGKEQAVWVQLSVQSWEVAGLPSPRRPEVFLDPPA